MMDDGEVDLSSHLLMSSTDESIDFDELMRSSSMCTHTHTCNPPGPNVSGHTHTCYHTHTQFFTSDEGEGGGEEEPKKPRKPMGNREAVRKYREKKKAHAAYLEEEVKKLRQVNQQLLRKLQGQTALEAEVQRLRALLIDLRGKIDAELGVFPFQKQCTGTAFQCDAYVPCVTGNVGTVGCEGGCEPTTVGCRIDPNGNMVAHRSIQASNSMGMVGSFV